MQYRSLFLIALLAAACGSDNNENNTSTNNATGTSNATNNTSTATNNATNNTSNATNGATNNTSNATNNQTNTVDYIQADIDGTVVLADAEEGGVEPMGPVVQLRKTTGETSSPIQIFRITVPAVEVMTFDCGNPDVSVVYSELNGQLINNWSSSDMCSVDITAVDPRVVGTFSATTSDGNTTLELTNGEFSLTP